MNLRERFDMKREVERIDGVSNDRSTNTFWVCAVSFYWIMTAQRKLSFNWRTYVTLNLVRHVEHSRSNYRLIVRKA